MADENKKKVATNKKTDSKNTTTAKKTTSKKTETKSAVKAPAKTVKTEVKLPGKKVDTKSVNASKKVQKADVEIENVASATVKYERISSRKVAIVANLIRGKNVDEAMGILTFTRKAGSEVLIKLLKSAIANAENTKNMTHSKLYVAEIYSNQGPTLKRIRPAAKGSAVRIRKRTSHTTIVLKERD